MIIASVVVLVVVALALGLGLGLGLSNGDSEAAFSGCITVDPSQQKPAAEWKLKIPNECPSQLSCPAGISPPLLVLSLDGFRADYLLRNMTPTLDYLINCGVHVPYMRATFPTKTFPNHYTMATGLYAESHGIIDNNFYDPFYDEVFYYGGVDTNDSRWWLGDPVWNTAKRAGKKVATMMWPGTDVSIGNMRPDICYNYNELFSLDDRVKTVLDWFEGDPSTFPDLAMIYFEQPDSAGHSEGPFGDSVNGNLTYVDGLVNQLLVGFQQINMQSCLNFVIVADHGMAGMDCDRIVDLTQYIDTYKYTVYKGAHARMTSQYFYSSKQTVNPNPEPVPVDVTLSELKCQYYNTSRDYYVRFHRKQDLPKRYHYSNNRCIDEIVMDLEDDYYLADLRGGACSISAGSHGADNTYKSMHAMFIASGPAFQQGNSIDAFQNIELYNFLCEVLEIEPSPNNGTYNLLSQLLKSYKSPQPGVAAFRTAERCLFPEDFDERERRRNESHCVASSACLDPKTVEEADSQLNLTNDEVEESIKLALPFGLPSSDDPDVCILVQKDYISGYNQKYHMPLWTAFSILPESQSSILDNQFRSDAAFEDCARADVRLNEGIDCSKYDNASIGTVRNLVFPPGLASSNESMTDGYLASNLVPMFEGFKRGIWKRTLHSLEEYAAKYGQLQVLLGPIFDYNADGLNDTYSNLTHFTTDDEYVPIPSHYFAIASFCNSTTLSPKDCANSTRVLSFILPHTNSDNNCRDQLPVPDDYLRQNTAKVRDVELLTGLSLFGNMSIFYRLKLLTYLNEELWPKISWLEADGDCPDVSTPKCPASYQKPPLLLISLDGFRSDYLNKKLSPVLDRLKRCGVSTPYMKSIYPTLTFPNHHTISTGLYPESHGIIDNSMYDLKLNQSFYLGSPNAINPAWWYGEPIWNTLVKESKHAMTFFWPGSDVAIGGMRPTEYVMYDGSIPYQVRVDTALKWLNGSSEGVYPDLVVLYFSKVDEAGHEGGPASLQVDEAIEAVDKALQQLMDGIYHLKLHTCINIITVSDHGMSDISCSRSVLVGDYLPQDVMEKVYVYPGAAGRISNQYTRTGNNYYPVPESEQVPLDEIVGPLKCKSSNMIALDKRQMPRYHHYINQDRIDDVLLVMADTWLMDRTTPWCAIKGQHGWDPNYDTMEALFIGYGPGFKDRIQVEPFENIELYNLMAYLTEVSSPAPNNGTEGSLHHLLRNAPPIPSQSPGIIYLNCPFPSTDDDYYQRANLTNTGCQCSQSSFEIETFDSRLNMTSSEQDNLETVHVSHGKPIVNYTDDVCVLHHADFVSGYSHSLKMPVWSSFDLTSAQVVSRNMTIINCTRPDVRLSLDQQITCTDYQLASKNGTLSVFLFPPEWSSSDRSVPDSLLLSNQVPMQKSFITDVWNLLINYFAEITRSSGHLQIIFGPIFDSNGDGLQDNYTRLAEQNKDGILVPSHYFAIALRCENATSDCSDMNYDPLTFILPNWNNSRSENCQNLDQFLLQNVARIRDVELLTGLRFLTMNPTQMSIQRRVQTPERLWS